MHTNKFSRIVIIASLLFGTSLAAAPGPQQKPTFRSGTQVVEVDVRVFDKDGHFVTDLKPEDFEVREDGVSEPIATLTLVNGSPAAPAAAGGAASATPASPAAPSAPAAAATPTPPAIWIFVFDTTHLSAAGLHNTQRAVEEFLQTKFRDGDIGGVLFEGKMANNRLTSNRDELLKAVESMKLPGDAMSYQIVMRREWPRLQDEFEAWRIADQNDRDALQQAVMRACSDDPDRCKAAEPDAEVRNKARQVLDAARAATGLSLRVVDGLANGLARMAGPKTVVFFSEGFLSLGEESEVQHASGAANRAGAHFYTVDARGLNKGSGASIIDEPASFDAAGPSTRFDMQEDGTNALAVDTGGMAIRNENNFGRALDMIQRDAATYYVLGYTPSNQAFDGKYRTISVTVKRPGVKVRARRGYLALEPAKLIKPTPITAPADVRRPSAATEQPSSGVEAPAAAAAESAAVPASAATPAAAPAAGAPLPGATGTSADPAAADPTAEATKASASALRKRIESNGLVEELQGPTARLAPGKSDDLAGKGWAAYQKGDVENAARYLGQASKSPDVHPWVNYALGLSHLALQQYPDAVRAWEDVRRAEPDFEPVYFNLADGYMLQRDEPAALRVLHDAEQRWPKDPELWNAIGVLQVRRGDYDAAIESFRKATTVAPEDSLGVFNLAKAYQLRALKFQRFDSARERWVGGEGDLKKASEYYARYVQLGGPFVQQAKEALQMLTWK